MNKTRIFPRRKKEAKMYGPPTMCHTLDLDGVFVTNTIVLKNNGETFVSEGIQWL